MSKKRSQVVVAPTFICEDCGKVVPAPVENGELKLWQNVVTSKCPACFAVDEIIRFVKLAEEDYVLLRPGIVVELKKLANKLRAEQGLAGEYLFTSKCGVTGRSLKDMSFLEARCARCSKAPNCKESLLMKKVIEVCKRGAS